MEKFWCCYVNGKGNCQKKHEFFSDAEKEAKRLARLPDNIGREVVVLEAIASCKTKPNPIQWEVF